MPQLDLFLHERDEDRLVEFLLVEGFQIIPDVLYDQPEYSVGGGRDFYNQFRRIKGSFYLIHESFYKCPLETVRLDSGEAFGKYFIIPKNGGPVFHLTCRGLYESDHGWILAPSMIDYYRTYWNTKLGRNELAPESQRMLWKKIVKFLRKHSVLTEPRGFLVGINAALQFKEGDFKMVGPLGYSYKLSETARGRLLKFQETNSQK